ncbi:M28 family metallopeptidase [Microbulbifer sp. VAAF005]|uniref:M28 family metallopeptidase n=1 Tax=unclassified Microbulbifer TaxID=2619833 RepID=UPI0024AC8518|nr:M28 family metallopeptidase [Microbulbifer sp. VAAF005]WHI47843.1 M28 family metallopeptidase [Microbulbifer sp. VAAF005]
MRIPTTWRRLGLAIAIGGVISGCSKGNEEVSSQAHSHKEHIEHSTEKLDLEAAEKAQIDTVAADLHKHVAVLASDEFEGRAPASKGEELTVNYLAEQFKALGLTPGAVDSDGNPSWFQEVPIVEMDIQSTSLTIQGEGVGQVLKPIDDMVAFTQRQTSASSLNESELVFVGYGIVAPENNWNDYAGLDMEGKTAVILVNDPGYATQDEALFNGNAMTYYGRWSYKFEEAARQGAAGAIIVHENGAAGYPWEVVSGSWSGAQVSLEAENKNIDRVAIEAWITNQAAKDLFQAAGLDLAEEMAAAKASGFKPKSLELKASIELSNSLEKSNSRNVIAKLPGKKYADETIVYTAHWDHLGVNRNASGEDHIFNGAVDNATGTAGLLALAAQAVKEDQADRSLVFVAVTAEESGLLGSKYYAANPVEPLEKTVAGFNFDAMNVLGPTKDITVVGFGSSELENLLEAAAKKQGRYLAAEEHPERGYFYRSDHFSLAKEGVPMLYFDSGSENHEHGREWAQSKDKEYLSQHYHKPGDEYDPNWNLKGAAMNLQLGLQLGLKLANSRDWPNWYEGNEFRAIRDASAESRK